MLASIPLPLFLEWMDYYDVEPFGEERADLRSAIVAQVVASSIPTKSKKRFKVKDFMPSFEKKSKHSSGGKQTAEQMKSTFLAFAEAQNKMVAQNKPMPKKPEKLEASK